MSDDQRLIRARAMFDNPPLGEVMQIADALRDLIAYAEERLRVNVGLVAENADLRKQLAAYNHGSPA